MLVWGRRLPRLLCLVCNWFYVQGLEYKKNFGLHEGCLRGVVKGPDMWDW